jgi:hypothetical protein
MRRGCGDFTTDTAFIVYARIDNAAEDVIDQFVAEVKRLREFVEKFEFLTGILLDEA